MLPGIIEYLSSQQRSLAGGRLCRPGRLQFAFPLIPPGFQLNFSINPPFNAYAAIKYGMSYQCLPGVVYLETEQAGDIYIAGLIEADHMREMLPYYILYTVQSPINVLLINQSALNQQALGTQYMLIIQTEDDLKEVREHLRACSMVESNRLASEANELLRAIATGAPPPTSSPSPSIAGGS